MTIVENNISSDSDTVGISQTFSHTIGSGSDRYLLVFTHVESVNSNRVSTVTYSGVAMTKVIAQTQGRDESSIWYMDETDLPSSGAHDVVITLTSGSGNEWYNSGAIDFTGVKQETPEASAGSSATNATEILTNVTPISTTTKIYDILGLGANNNPTVEGSQTEKFDESGASGRGVCALLDSSDTSEKTMGWDFNNTNRIAHACCVIAEAGGGMAFERTASQTITISHTNPRALVLGRTVSQTITELDSVARAGSTFVRTIAQSIIESDAVARIIGFPRTAIQTITESDAVSRAGSTFNRIVTQSITESDSITRILAAMRTASQTITESDVVVAVKNAGGTAFERVVSQTITISDSVARLLSQFRTPSQSLTHSEAISRIQGHIRTIAQSITISTVTPRILDHSRTAIQTITHSDSTVRAGVFVRTITQTITHSSIVVVLKAGAVTVRLRAATVRLRAATAYLTKRVADALLTKRTSSANLTKRKADGFREEV